MSAGSLAVPSASETALVEEEAILRKRLGKLQVGRID